MKTLPKQTDFLPSSTPSHVLVNHPHAYTTRIQASVEERLCSTVLFSRSIGGPRLRRSDREKGGSTSFLTPSIGVASPRLIIFFNRTLICSRGKSYGLIYILHREREKKRKRITPFFSRLRSSIIRPLISPSQTIIPLPARCNSF